MRLRGLFLRVSCLCGVGFGGVVVLASVVGLGPTPESADERGGVAPVENDWSVRNEKQALAQVAEISGLPHDLLQESAVELVTLGEDTTPFLSEQIIGRPLWQVTTPTWKLQLPSAIEGFEDRYQRIFDILVDPVNGSILKILSRWPEGVPEIAPEPPADDAEADLFDSMREMYHSFPQDRPTITFLQALDVVGREGSSSPLVAKQILAHYVMCSRMGGEPTAVWAITLRGIRMWRSAPPPTLRKGSSLREAKPSPEVGEMGVGKMRDIVDATTGAWLRANNLPRPEPSD